MYHDPNNTLDPCFGNPSLVLHMEGENGSTQFIDNSANAFAVTPNGGVALSSTQKRFGNTSASFASASSQFLTLPSSAQFNFGTGDFTIEGWVYPTDLSSGVYHRWFGGANNEFAFYSLGSGAGCGLWNISGIVTPVQSTLTINAWNHVAVTRQGTLVRVFVNGTQTGSTGTDSTNLSYAGSPRIGAAADGTGAGFAYMDGYIDEFIVWKGVCRYKTNFQPQTFARPGPSYPAPVLLLHMNGNTGLSQPAFIDSSISNKAVTAVGGAATSATQSKFNGTSGSFNGSTSYLTLADSEDWNFGSGDFTIEFWIYINSLAVQQQLLGHWGATGNRSWQLLLNTSGSISFNRNDAALINAGSLTTGQWYHVAVSRRSSITRLFVNGTKVSGDASDSATYVNSTDLLNIGRNADGGGVWYFNGFMQELVIWKGFGKYTANFSIPQQQYSNGTPVSTVLMLRGNGVGTGFVDNSTYARAVTVFGNTTQAATNIMPFIDNSIEFDGNGDYLTLASNSNWDLSNCDFTIEFWFRITTTNGTVLISLRDLAGTANGLQIGSGGIGSTAFYFGVGSAGATASLDTTVSTTSFAAINDWHYCVAQRKGTKLELYIDGQLAATQAGIFGGIIAASGLTYSIGTYLPTPAAAPLAGQMSDIRITRGVALYDGNFARPADVLGTPTDPHFSSVSLLMHGNGTNGSTTIVDSSNNKFTPTLFGNTQISTAQSKFGGSAISFDGTGDYLTYAHNTAFDLSSGNWTIEGWFYATATTAPLSVIMCKNGLGGTFVPTLRIGLNPTQLQVTLGNPSTGLIQDFGASFTVNRLNTWHHFAVCRSGSTIHRAIDGVVTSSALTVTMGDNGRSLFIGWEENQSSTFYWNGYLDDIRITKGVARYTASFTPPIRPYTDYLTAP